MTVTAKLLCPQCQTPLEINELVEGLFSVSCCSCSFSTESTDVEKDLKDYKPEHQTEEHIGRDNNDEELWIRFFIARCSSPDLDVLGAAKDATDMLDVFKGVWR